VEADKWNAGVNLANNKELAKNAIEEAIKEDGKGEKSIAEQLKTERKL
jgi:hypothetical protein